MKIFFCVLVVGAGFGIYWFTSSPDDHAAEWVKAIGVCASDPIGGAAMISSLESLYGWQSWPDKLDLQISLCNLKSATLKLQE